MLNDTAYNANAFASTFYFLQRTKQPHQKIKRACRPTHPTVQGFVRTSNSEALNVECFGQTVSELQTDELRTNSRAAHNIRLKEILKRRALRGKQRVEHLINSVGKRTVVLLNPSFFYFFNPFFLVAILFDTSCIPTKITY